MAEEIKRVNFFDGLFLKEQEFKDEQNYHIHMRRRINYILFEKSGVISVNPTDLKFVINTVNETFKVNAGMAIGINENDLEAKEMILTQDSGEISLSSQKIWVTIHYDDSEVTDESSEGGETGFTRRLEKAIIKDHTSQPGPGDTAANGERYVVLGAIEPDGGSWQENYDDREVAKIRGSLLEGQPSLPAPTITDPPFGDGSSGSEIKGVGDTLVINGTNFYNPLKVIFLNADPNEDFIELPGNAVSDTRAEVVIQTGVKSGPVKVKTNTDTSNDSSVDFTLASLPAPTISDPSFGDGSEPARTKHEGDTLVINGTNFYEPLWVLFPNVITGGQKIKVEGNAISQTEAHVTVPGGIKSGKIVVETNSGPSDPSPTRFIFLS